MRKIVYAIAFAVAFVFSGCGGGGTAHDETANQRLYYYLSARDGSGQGFSRRSDLVVGLQTYVKNNPTNGVTTEVCFPLVGDPGDDTVCSKKFEFPLVPQNLDGNGCGRYRPVIWQDSIRNNKWDSGEDVLWAPKDGNTQIGFYYNVHRPAGNLWSMFDFDRNVYYECASNHEFTALVF